MSITTALALFRDPFLLYYHIFVYVKRKLAVIIKRATKNYGGSGDRAPSVGRFLWFFNENDV